MIRTAPPRLTFHAQVGARYVAFLRRSLRSALPMLRCPLCDIGIALVNDRRMAELHERFMNIKGPTDVLTFPLEEDRRGRVISGELVICVPEASRRARDLSKRVDHELLLYALHGVLHLCGFDDRTGAGFREMHSKEDAILTRLGVGPVFSTSMSSSPAKSGLNRKRKRRRL